MFSLSRTSNSSRSSRTSSIAELSLKEPCARQLEHNYPTHTKDKAHVDMATSQFFPSRSPTGLPTPIPPSIASEFVSLRQCPVGGLASPRAPSSAPLACPLTSVSIGWALKSPLSGPRSLSVRSGAG